MSELPPGFGTPGRHTPKRDAKTKARKSIAYQTAFFKRRSLHPFKFEYSNQIEEQTNQVTDILNNIKIGNFEQEKAADNSDDDFLLSDDENQDPETPEIKRTLKLDVQIVEPPQQIQEKEEDDDDKNISSDTVIIGEKKEDDVEISDFKITDPTILDPKIPDANIPDQKTRNSEIPDSKYPEQKKSNSTISGPIIQPSKKPNTLNPAILKETLTKNLPKNKPSSSLNRQSLHPSTKNSTRPYTPLVFSAPSADSYKKPNNTPRSAFRPVTTPGRPRTGFDLVESLKKKPSWKMHTGKLKPFGSYTPEARIGVERAQKMENGRDVERREALAKFKRKTVVFDKARDEFLQKVQNKPEANEAKYSQESTDINIPETKNTLESKISEAKTP